MICEKIAPGVPFNSPLLSGSANFQSALPDFSLLDGLTQSKLQFNKRSFSSSSSSSAGMSPPSSENLVTPGDFEPTLFPSGERFFCSSTKDLVGQALLKPFSFDLKAPSTAVSSNLDLLAEQSCGLSVAPLGFTYEDNTSLFELPCSSSGSAANLATTFQHLNGYNSPVPSEEDSKANQKVFYQSLVNKLNAHLEHSADSIGATKEVMSEYSFSSPISYVSSLYEDSQRLGLLSLPQTTINSQIHTPSSSSGPQRGKKRKLNPSEKIAKPQLFKCKEKNCNKVFETLYNLKSHYTTHSTERPFQCVDCPSSFRRKQDLSRHSLIHLGEKPFPCPICDARFSRKDAQKRHSTRKKCKSGLVNMESMDSPLSS